MNLRCAAAPLCSLNLTTAVAPISTAVTQTSPSPCAKCPSPVENRPPSWNTGRNSFAPLLSCFTSKLPPFSRGGSVRKPVRAQGPAGTAPVGSGGSAMPPFSMTRCSRAVHSLSFCAEGATAETPMKGAPGMRTRGICSEVAQPSRIFQCTRNGSVMTSRRKPKPDRGATSGRQGVVPANLSTSGPGPAACLRPEPGIGVAAFRLEAGADEIGTLVEARKPAREHAQLLEPLDFARRAEREVDAEALGDRRENPSDLLLRETEIAVERGGARQARLLDLVVVPDELDDPTEHVHPVFDVVDRALHEVCQPGARIGQVYLTAPYEIANWPAAHRASRASSHWRRCGASGFALCVCGSSSTMTHSAVAAQRSPAKMPWPKRKELRPMARTRVPISMVPG